MSAAGAVRGNASFSKAVPKPTFLMANIHSQSGQGDAFFQLSLVSGPGDRIAN